MGTWRRARQASALSGIAVAALVLGAALQGVSEPPSAALPGLDPSRIVVMFDDGVPLDLPNFAAAHSARVELSLPNLGGAVLQTDDSGALLEALLDRDDVAAAEVDFALHTSAAPDDPRASAQWALGSVGLPAAWDRGFGSHAVRIALLDTGVDLFHEDIAANVCAARNFVDPPRSPVDDLGHGTHTAGIAVGAANNGVGIAGASQSCLLLAKVCDAAGDCAVSLTAAGIDWALNPDGDAATQDAAHILSMSFGSPFHSGTLEQAVQRAWQAGVLVVASAGNEQCGLVDFPAAYDEVVAVSALERAPLASATGRFGLPSEVRASYASCGPEVELTAPGSDILSTVPGNRYAELSGTSMAAPLVAGIAGLVKASNPALTNAQLRCVLDDTAQDLGAPGRDLEHGFGKVRADLAVAGAAQGASCDQPHGILPFFDEDP
ncbi:MAG TPA: S8 family peptidase [Candidatus Thermoplasmatota archaeon]|jgi:subtilisin family serine protease|nr:S8 family peptidase [Candidatus Thermoplasmatota archaeon]